MLTEVPVRTKHRTVVSTPDRISAIDLSDKPDKGLFGEKKSGRYIVTVNFMCGKHFIQEFRYTGDRDKDSAKQDAREYLQELITWAG